ncbi:MAG: AraC family transcriptional regulator [Oscillospiraceae bacterium]|nr:AraC family transcriptional regulator [Oscillospiraceae bacterium]
MSGLLLLEICPAAEADIFDIIVVDLNVEVLYADRCRVVAVALHIRPLWQHHHCSLALTGAVPHVEVRCGLVGTGDALVEGLSRVGCCLLRHRGSAGRAGGCIVGEMGISATSLKNYFRAVYGQNISEYLKEKRINQAKKLLAETNLSVLDIANKVGFESRSKFTAMFHAAICLTPTEFRRSISQKEIGRT